VVDLVNGRRAQTALATRAEVEREDRFREVSLGLTEASARREGQRCLRCDAVTRCSKVEVKTEVRA